eukprot:155120_1
MRALLLLLFIIIQLIYSLFGQNCVYSDSTSGYTLYLDALAHATLRFTANEPDDKHTYTYTPCRNAAGECPNSSGEGGINTAMCRQTLSTDPSVCTVIANTDSTQPSYNPSGNGTWEFQFSNGDDEGCGSPRNFNVFLVCDMNAGDYKIVSAGELHSSCNYEFNIRTKWACPGQVYTESSSSLSGGWIFVILFLSIFFAYFAFGWCFCAYLNRKDRGYGDVFGNIPHVTFWTKLPALTFAGCCFTKDFLCGLCSKGGN